ncbi:MULTISPECIES: Hsp20/alpha crystallin family protein [Pyrobaculum]|jgi:HSP20 family protein|uniref:Small heat shock protein, hsp20-like, conjectural n=1 Tax=Pyrobaculum ferrireducens TaxID=1104324 RepID=G7VEP8_9CREN|nr:MULTISPECIES: Hsp20/alpha crystallin family protein [Pyrobaculum]AET32864.1 small heat shock protein, hsp20-like, conjectural [Pyrobaculum ferrireducens]MCU7787316.1 Hsp20/alpha crystallin family protein [Pyrobaculum sp. 3827-6]
MEEFKKAMEEISKSLQKMVEELKEKRDYRLVEEGDEVRIEIDMPGLEPSDISLSVTKDGTALRAEGARGDRKYSRHIRLPVKIDPSSISALYRNGVLTITARKVKEEEIRIPVRG